MKKKDHQERELKENTTNYAVLKNWWILVQAVESIRSDNDAKRAIFRLGTAIQSFIDQSIELGKDRVAEAIPLERGDLLDIIIAEGQLQARIIGKRR